MQPIVQFEHVTAGYQGVPALRDISLSLYSGQFTGIVGPSGSGKTSMLRAVLGALDIYDGRVLVEGREIRGRGRVRVGYVPQLETVDWNFPVTVGEVVLMGRAMESGVWPWPRHNDRKEMHELLDRLGIGDLHDRHIRNLSGGQQQRAFLARALFRSPRLLLLDEPTSGVDLRTRDDILHVLAELNQGGVTVVMSTHELNSVAAHLPWVICINRGIVAQGHPGDVFTPEVLSRTYGGEMLVVKQGGMTLVADQPHFLRDALAGGGPPIHHDHGHPADHHQGDVTDHELHHARGEYHKHHLHTNGAEEPPAPVAAVEQDPNG